MKSYADALEAYLIPLQESIFGMLFGSSAKKPVQKQQTNIVSQVQNHSTINTEEILEKIKEEYPNEIKKELSSRLNTIKNIIKVLQDIEKKYKKNPNIEGFFFQTNKLKKLLKYPNISEDDWDEDDLEFFSEIIPYNLSSDTHYVFPIIYTNIYAWSLKIYGTDRIDYMDWEGRRDFDEMENILIEEVTKQCSRYPHFFEVGCDGNSREGVINICLKPSDKIMTLTKKYK